MSNTPSACTLILTLGLALVAGAPAAATPQQSSNGATVVFTDCDANGLDDALEIDAAPESDANFNARLDRCEGLSVDRLTISAREGGTLTMQIELGENAAYEPYWILGTTAGSDPGIYLGNVRVPLNYDGKSGYMNKTTYRPNKDELTRTLGLLDGNGASKAYLTLPPDSAPSLIGTVVHHACVVYKSRAETGYPVWSSNAVALEIVP